MEAQLKTQFRDIVIEDVQGLKHLELRTDQYLELWLQDLIDLRIDTEIRISMLEDAEMFQGSMNHHVALDKSRGAINRTIGFTKAINGRIAECLRLIEIVRARQKLGMQGPAFNTLPKDVKTLSRELQTQRELLDKANYQLLHTTRIVKDIIDGVKCYKGKLQETSQEGFNWKNRFRSLLVQVICRWEDGILDVDFIEELKIVTGFDEQPLKKLPKAKKKALREQMKLDGVES